MATGVGSTGVDCEPKVKRQKFEKIERLHPIFESFLDTNDKSKLERALKALEYGFSGMTFGAVHVDGCNAVHCVNFQETVLITSAHNLNPDSNCGKPRGGFVRDIFLHGIEVLKKYLNTECRQVPYEELKREALQKLLTFLTAKQDQRVIFEEKNSEGKWNIILAQHLLSKLAVHGSYTITSYSGYTLQGDTLCLCNEKDQLVGEIGDTSFGCKKGWHGEADIIMDDEVPISVLSNVQEDEELSVSSVDEKVSQLNSTDITQVMSQTIVFSFLQQKKNKGKMRNFLVPGIGIGANVLFACFYDSENDVLLQCSPIELFNGGVLCPTAVLFLWLTLNYRLFCSGISEEMKPFKADFIKNLGDKAEMYLEDVDRPMHVPHTNQEDLFSWLPPLVLPDERKLPGQKFIDF